MMDERKFLRNRIKQYAFTLKDLNLYLDTHPDCRRALAMFKKTRELYEKAVAEYNQKFGPITPNQSNDDNHWSWIDDPWPWERS